MHAMLPNWFQYAFSEHEPFVFILVSFAFMLLLALPLASSRRINARLLPATKPHFLQQLAQGIAPPILSGKRRQIQPGKKLARGQHNVSLRSRARREKLSRAVLWLHWLLCDKLRLLPSVESNRSINRLFLLFMAWLISATIRWFFANEFRVAMVQVRFGATYATLQEQLQFFFSIFLMPLLAVAIVSPFFLMKKNREAYLDFFALFMLWQVTYQKLRCFYWNCCFGLPWASGIFHGALGIYVFPIQLVEFAVGVLLTILCVLFITRSRFYKPGRGLSLALISFALPRFFVEFWRYRSEFYRSIAVDGFIFGLTIEQVVCIIAIIMAIVWWFSLPLAKKTLDWISDIPRRVLAWFYLRPRVHARLSKYFNWHSAVAKLEEEHLT
ncbi:MAG: hypothetical protein FWE40_06640 [Oscillospiraceae bacterium]|nr:hypothetical protein [Oscillospiraceae bacterium]